MRGKIKVCYLTEDFYPSIIGGQGIIGKNIVEGLSKKNIEVTVIAEHRKGRRQYWSKFPKIEFVPVPFCFGNQLLLAVFEYLYFLIRYQNIYFDIVHANQLSGLFFVLFKPKNIGKICVSVHNTYWDLSRATDSKIKKNLYKPLILLEKLMYQKAEGLIFNTPSEQKLFFANYNLKKIPSTVAFLGAPQPKNLDKDKIRARKLIQKKFNIRTKKIVLYVGRLVQRKRVDLFIKTLSILKDEEIIGIIVGDGKEKSNLKKLSSKNIFFVGYQDNPTNFFLASDLFFNLSVAEGGVILTALEAASFGLPLLLSKESVEGVELLKDNSNGLFAKSSELTILANEIKKILRNQKIMGIRSRLLARKYTWDKCCDSIINFYKGLKIL